MTSSDAPAATTTATTTWSRSLERASQLPLAGATHARTATDPSKGVIEKSIEPTEPDDAPPKTPATPPAEPPATPPAEPPATPPAKASSKAPPDPDAVTQTDSEAAAAAE